MRDHTGYYRTTPRPTPPSDAGTSERETGRCARPGCDYARELHPVDDGDTYCPEFVPAAPAAEGPREAEMPDAWTLLRLKDIKDFTIRRGATPTSPIVRDIEQVAYAVAHLLDDAARLDWLQKQVHDAADGSIGDVGLHGNWTSVAVEVGRTPIIAQGEGPTLRAAVDAARLASPSPTGAPAEQQKN